MLRASVLRCRLQGIARHARGLKSPSAIGMAQMVSISVMVRIKDYCTSIQMALDDAVADRDNTGCLISHAAGRADVQALIAVGAMCRGTHAWADTQQSVYLVGFALQLYYTWPMTTLCALAFRRTPVDTGVWSMERNVGSNLWSVC